jgi:hypothetical protein
MKPKMNENGIPVYRPTKVPLFGDEANDFDKETIDIGNLHRHWNNAYLKEYYNKETK